MRPRLRRITRPVAPMFAVLMLLHNPVHAEAPAPPTVLRGITPPAPCPPGTYVAADYHCVPLLPSGYNENQPEYGYSPDYGYWPDYGYGPIGVIGYAHRFARVRRHAFFHPFHGFRAFPGFHAAGGFSPGIGGGFARGGGLGR